MKTTDSYKAKLDLWARKHQSSPLPTIANLPRFGSKKFSSHTEMNAWKQQLLETLAQRGGARWTK